METYNDSSDEDTDTTIIAHSAIPTYDELKQENQALRQEVEILRLRNSILEAGEILASNSTNDKQNTGDDSQSHDTKLDSPPRGNNGPLATDSPGKAWNSFTDSDRQQIVNYIKANNIRNAGIRTGIWEKMKKEAFSGSPHTVQSLENHFRKKILPKLDTVLPCEQERAQFVSQLESPSPAKKRRL